MSCLTRKILLTRGAGEVADSTEQIRFPGRLQLRFDGVSPVAGVPKALNERARAPATARSRDGNKRERA